MLGIRPALFSAALLLALTCGGGASAAERVSDVEDCKDYGPGHYDEDIASCTRVIEAGVKYSPAQTAFAYRMRGWARFEQNDRDSAVADYTKAIELNRSDQAAFVFRAQAFFDAHDLDRALSDADEAVRLEPDDAEALSTRASIEREQGVFERAYADVTKIIGQGSQGSLAKYYIQRADICRESHTRLAASHAQCDWKTMLSDLATVTKEDTGSSDDPFDSGGDLYTLADAYQVEGAIYEETGDLELAFKANQRALLLVLDCKECEAALDRIKARVKAVVNSSNSKALAAFKRGNADYKRGALDRAISEFDQAIKLDPRDARFFYARGLAYADKHDSDRAFIDFEDAFDRDPTNTAARDARNRVYDERGDLDQELGRLSELIPQRPPFVDPALPEMHNTHGLIYYALHEYDYALDDFAEAIKLNPDFGAAMWNRARTYCALGASWLQETDGFNAMLKDGKYPYDHPLIDPDKCRI